MPSDKSRDSRTGWRSCREAYLLVFALVLVASGCASYQELRIESEPTGAEVFVDQRLVGTTPLNIRVDRLRDHGVFVKKEGFQPEMVVLTKRDSPEGVDYLTPADVFVSLLRLRSTGPGALPAASELERGSTPSTGGAGERDRDVRIDPESRESAPGGR